MVVAEQVAMMEVVVEVVMEVEVLESHQALKVIYRKALLTSLVCGVMV